MAVNVLISARSYDPHYIISSVDALELNKWQRYVNSSYECLNHSS